VTRSRTTHATRSAIAIGVVLGFAIGRERSALADPARDPASAQLLFERGRAALDRGEVDAACEMLDESYRLDPAVGTLFNLAACEERQGKIASAWLHLREGIGQISASDERLKPADARARALEARLPRLVVRLVAGAPAGTRVTRDGVELSSVSLGLALPVNPGAHRVVAVADGRAPSETDVRIAEGETRTVEVGPGAARPGLASSSVPASVDAPSGHGWRTAGFVTGGVGVAALAVGSVAGLMALGSASTVDRECDAAHVCSSAGLAALDDVKTTAPISTVGLVAGAALVATGIVILLVAKPTPGRGPATVGVLTF